MEQENKVPSKTISQTLKKLREKRGWSQGQVSKRSGLDPQRISKYERGIISPSVDMVVKLANTFEVSLDYLVLGEEDVNLQQIQNRELLKRFGKISQLPERDQKALIEIMDALIRNNK